MSKKQEDVNYDLEEMEMSDDDNDSDSSDSDSGSSSKGDAKAEVPSKPVPKAKKDEPAERELFSNEDDYRAFKDQFDSNGGKKKAEKPQSSEYGSVKKTKEPEDEPNEYGGGGSNDVRPAVRPGNEKLKRLRQLSNEDFTAVVKESEEDRTLASTGDNKKAKKVFPEKDRREKSSSERHSSSDDRDRRHRRERSRSASRDRKKSKRERREERRKRRSRSRSHDRSHRRHRSRSSSRDRHRHHNRNEPPQRCDKRQELRNRKLVALGLTQATTADHRQLQAAAGMTPAGVAAALANSYSSPDQVEAQLAHVKAVTGVDLPKYYNPTAINPLKFAEQIKKRQMLWGAKKPESSEGGSSDGHANPPAQQSSSFQQSQLQLQQQKMQQQQQQQQQQSQQQQHQAGSYNKWESTNFGNSQTNEKFRRLMGIKGGAAPSSESGNSSSAPPPSDRMFVDQELEYERARAITHTQRGLGLGFASAPTFKADPNVAAPKPSTAGISFVKK